MVSKIVSILIFKWIGLSYNTRHDAFSITFTTSAEDKLYCLIFNIYGLSENEPLMAAMRVLDKWNAGDNRKQIKYRHK